MPDQGGIRNVRTDSWKARRLVRVFAAWGKTWTTGRGLIWGGLAVCGGYNLGYVIWAVLNRRAVDQMIAGGTRSVPSPRSLAWCLGLGVLLALAWWVGQVYWGKGQGEELYTDAARAARRVGLLNALIPLMYTYWSSLNQWANRSVVAVAMGTVLGLASAAYVSRAPLPARWLSRSGERVSLPLVIGLALLFLVGTSWVGVLRHRSLNSGALDMAMMDQLVWNTAHGRLLEGTFTGRYPGSFLKHHFSPALAMLAPLYWLWSAPETLIVVQGAAVALSALCLYSVGIRLTGQRWLSACVSMGLLAHPALHEGVLFDFHQDALGMLFLSFGLMCVAHERWAWAGLGWLLSLACKEEMAIYWIAISVYLSLQEGKRRRFFGAFGLLNLAWLLAVVYLVIPAFNRQRGSPFEFWARYGEFGVTPLEWAVTFGANPIYVLRTMLAPARVWGVAVLVSPVLFFLWTAGPGALVLLSPLAINLLSNLNLQHGFSIHYSMLPLVMVSTTAFYGARRWFGETQWFRAPATLSSEGLGSLVMVTSLVLFAWLSPLGLRIDATLRQYEVDVHDEIGHQIADTLPPTACVVAQNTILPHLSQRECIGLFPRPTERDPDYYVLDVTANLYPLSPEQYHRAVVQVIERPDYGPTRVEDGYIVLRRGVDRARVPEALTMLAEMGPVAGK